MDYFKSGDTLANYRKCVRAMSTFELFLILYKLGHQTAIAYYVVYNCPTNLFGSSAIAQFCETEGNIIRELYGITSILSMELILGAIVWVDLSYLIISLLTYVGAMMNFLHLLKCCLRASIAYWFLGLTFWIYIGHNNQYHLAGVMLVFLCKLLSIIMLHKYVKNLHEKECNKADTPTPIKTKF